MPKPVQASTYTFRHIIEGGFLYVDKTRYLYDLVRPRRFGKSLMISTLEEIFLGLVNGRVSLLRTHWTSKDQHAFRPKRV